MIRRLPVLLLFVLTSCVSEDVDNEVLIRERADQQVALVTGNIRRNCQERVLETALARADSLLLDRAARMRRIQGRPPRPSRPGAPPVKELSRPLPLRPLFPFEIRFDTLLRDSLLRDSLLQDSLLQDGIRLDSLDLGRGRG